MADRRGGTGQSLAFGCIAVLILAAVIAGVLGVVFLWDVNAA